MGKVGIPPANPVPPWHRVWLGLFRPVTLFPVLIVAIVFGVVGAHRWPGTGGFLQILIAGVLLVIANGISNAVGGVGDIVEDRLHPIKRHRPVAAGLLSPMRVLSVGVIVWFCALLISLLILPKIFSVLYILIIIFAFSYSFYPRLKDRLFWNNAWIATPRGALGIVAMWSLYGSIYSIELWTILLLVIPLVFFGNESRNLEDRASDLAANVRTITTVFGDEAGRIATYLGFCTPPILVFVFGLYVTNPFLLFLFVPAVVMFWGCFHLTGRTIWLIFYGTFAMIAVLFLIPLILPV